MPMLIIKGLIAGIVVVLVSELAPRLPRIGGLILSLPIVSIIAFIVLWQKERAIEPVSALARETLILVPLGLGFFVPLALAKHYGLNFWFAFTLGIALAATTIGAWFWLAPKIGVGG